METSNLLFKLHAELMELLSNQYLSIFFGVYVQQEALKIPLISNKILKKSNQMMQRKSIKNCKVEREEMYHHSIFFK